MAGKYSVLETYFQTMLKDKQAVEFSFDEIEGILKFTLPASAYEDERWWLHEKEGNHVNLRAWTNAGWKVSKVDVHTRRVGFVRIARR